MKASDWEFENRALVFGLLFAVGFSASAIDHRNVTVAVADALAPLLGARQETVVRALLAVAVFAAVAAALVRTWASAWLHRDIVYASGVRAASLVADGPYRHVRNPLYVGNVLLAAGLGALASRLGFVLLVGGMILFCRRLIAREEAALDAAQRERYEAYRARVPRLWPSLRARVPAAGGAPDWRRGLTSELFAWGFAAALVVFAITLKAALFFAILAASVVALWAMTTIARPSGR
jgi:protein-S-isoprenylcysteine O-methyltransferase Ste14